MARPSKPFRACCSSSSLFRFSRLETPYVCCVVSIKCAVTFPCCKLLWSPAFVQRRRCALRTWWRSIGPCCGLGLATLGEFPGWLERKSAWSLGRLAGRWAPRAVELSWSPLIFPLCRT